MTTNHKIVFLFSGQGSQYEKMGEKLYQTNPIFSKSLQESDNIFKKHLGRSLIQELYQEKNNLDDLLFSTPAILAIESAMIAVLKEIGITPDYVAGNSIGEFVAAVSAGIWTKEEAFEHIIEHTKSIVQTDIDGGMLTIMNESAQQLMPLINKLELYIAAYNCPNNFTVSGSSSSLEAFQKELKQLDILYLRLPVNYPFHSPLIEPGKANHAYYFTTPPLLKKPVKGFISGLYCQELQILPEDYFWNVVSQPTNFISFVNYMEEKEPCLYIDLGPSGTSATFVKYNLPKNSTSIVHPIMTPYKRELEQLESLQELLQINR